MVNLGYTAEIHPMVSTLHVCAVSGESEVILVRLYVGQMEGSILCYQIEWTSPDTVTYSSLFRYSLFHSKIQLIVSSPLHTYVMFASGRHVGTLCVNPCDGGKWHTQMLHRQSISGLRFIKEENFGSSENAFLTSSFDGEITYWSIQSTDTGIKFNKNRVITQSDAPIYGLDVDPFGVQVVFLDTAIGLHSNSHDVQNNPYLRNNHGRLNIIPSPALLDEDDGLRLERFVHLLQRLVANVSIHLRIDYMAILRLLLYLESTPPYALVPETSDSFAKNGSDGSHPLVDQPQPESKTSFSLYGIWQTIQRRTKVPTSESIPRLLRQIDDSLSHNTNYDRGRLWKCLHALYCGSHAYHGLPMRSQVRERVSELRKHLLLLRVDTILQRYALLSLTLLEVFSSSFYLYSGQHWKEIL